MVPCDDGGYDDDNYDYDGNRRRHTVRRNSTARDIEGLTQQVSKLETDLAKLSIITEAMWELCRDKLAYSDAELRAKIKEVDLRDGKEDGKVTKRAPQCPKCHRKISMEHKKCMYCDIKVDDGSIF